VVSARLQRAATSVGVDGGEQVHASRSPVYRLAAIFMIFEPEKSVTHLDSTLYHEASGLRRAGRLTRIGPNVKCLGSQCNPDEPSEAQHFGHFTCWQVCPFDGGGNDMPPQNPDAEKQHRVSRELRGIACEERCSETKHDIHNSG